jgi:hypothetical protein
VDGILKLVGCSVHCECGVVGEWGDTLDGTEPDLYWAVSASAEHSDLACVAATQPITSHGLMHTDFSHVIQGSEHSHLYSPWTNMFGLHFLVRHKS